uniref:NADH dehydrogenase subunit 6 n=1 Tax=Metacrangonyx ilvanus TaxID=931575 RepID=K7ZVW4_9CRUS|nr:NADH dehydrogenase subunit 6 [Metacrangonyx ilvanus]CCI69556.1 NADH dehydrogenase subunit 6 [Metacrangonyx ilvanus]
MIYFIFSFFSYVLIIIFFYSWHPLFMGVTIALQSVIIGMTLYMFSTIPWFSYLLFMIFLSGMMVILIYVSSLASNLIMKYFFMEFKSILYFTILYFFFSYFFMKSNYFCENSVNFSNLPSMILLSGKMYSKEMYMLTVLLICYLLLVLILVVKNSLFTKGPLRSN